MFGVTLAAGELRTLCRKLRGERFLLASETLEETAGPLLTEMAKPWSGDSAFSQFSGLLTTVEQTLAVIHRQIRRMLTVGTRKELEQLLDKTKLFCLRQSNMVYYTAEDEGGGSMLCASATDLTAQLRQTLWRQERPMVLASGTLAVRNDFRRFKEETGLLADGRVREHTAPSPFDYQRNCLLYLPKMLPKQASGDYYDALAEQIARLLEGIPWPCPGAVYLLCGHVRSTGASGPETSALSHPDPGPEQWAHDGAIHGETRQCPAGCRRSLGGIRLSRRLCVPAHLTQAALSPS